MSESPKTIWFAPDEGNVSRNGWAGVQSGKDKLYFEDEKNHSPADDDIIKYTRTDIHQAALDRIKELEKALKSIIDEYDVFEYGLPLYKIGAAKPLLKGGDT